MQNAATYCERIKLSPLAAAYGALMLSQTKGLDQNTFYRDFDSFGVRIVDNYLIAPPQVLVITAQADAFDPRLQHEYSVDFAERIHSLDEIKSTRNSIRIILPATPRAQPAPQSSPSPSPPPSSAPSPPRAKPTLASSRIAEEYVLAQRADGTRYDAVPIDTAPGVSRYEAYRARLDYRVGKVVVVDATWSHTQMAFAFRSSQDFRGRLLPRPIKTPPPKTP